MNLWTKKNWLSRNRLCLDVYLGIFKSILQLCGIGHFPTICLVISRKSDQTFMKILSQIYLWTRKSGSWLRIHLGGGLHCPSAIVLYSFCSAEWFYCHTCPRCKAHYKPCQLSAYTNTHSSQSTTRQVQTQQLAESSAPSWLTVCWLSTFGISNFHICENIKNIQNFASRKYNKLHWY